MIALPPSPKLPLAEPSESTPEPSNEKILEGPPMPTSDAEVIVVQENDMASTRPVVTVENNGGLSAFRATQFLTDVPGSTPVLNDGRITDVNLALKTPISALLSSIQQGFDLTPCSPLSPPQDYLASSNSPVGTGPFKLGIIRQNVVAPAQP
jgi:CLIP-associating protein 1/2